MNELALFAGAGGGILGGMLLGWRTVAAVEIEDYPRRVLLQRQADGILPRFPIWDDVRTFDGKPWRGKVDVISGGFPCQDISAAGKGAGIDGARSGMWSQMARIIGEVRPRFAFVENSPLLVGRGLTRVLGDLAEMGYDAKWGILGAHHAGAPHKRDRIWIMAKSSSAGAGNINRKAGDKDRGASGEHVPPLRQGDGQDGTNRTDSAGPSKYVGDTKREQNNPKRGSSELRRDSMGRIEEAAQQAHGSTCSDSSSRSSCDAALAYASSIRQQRQRQHVKPVHTAQDQDGKADQSVNASEGIGEWWQSEPDVGRVAHGVASRMDRLKAIGNGQVPAVAALAWAMLGGTDE
tara:strand:+ start:28539 stop:29585 length:1047 start_codon:yes stop_codon:yes gene_type:complete